MKTSTSELTTYQWNEPAGNCIGCASPYYAENGDCPSCHIPTHLSDRIIRRGSPPQFVSLIGASGSGKTVYLGLLIDMLTKGTGTLKARIADPYSIALQEQTVAALQSRRFPQKTASEADGWNWVHCEVTTTNRRSEYIDLITPDFAGEAIALEMDNPGSYPAITASLKRSRAVIILCDSQNVCEQSLQEDLFAMKLASYVHSIKSEAGRLRRGGRVRNPFVVVLTKSDACPEAMDDPLGFATNNMPRLVHYCQASFSNYRFFAASAVGSHATLIDNLGRCAQFPIHTEPHGIIEPIEWILSSR